MINSLGQLICNSPADIECDNLLIEHVHEPARGSNHHVSPFPDHIRRLTRRYPAYTQTENERGE